MSSFTQILADIENGDIIIDCEKLSNLEVDKRDLYTKMIDDFFNSMSEKGMYEIPGGIRGNPSKMIMLYNSLVVANIFTNKRNANISKII